MMPRATVYESRGAAAWITLNQAERRNALSDELVSQLQADLGTALEDDDIRAIILTGAGSVFCAGADLKAGGVPADTNQEHPFIRLLKTIWHAPKPVIGRINGHAFGGGVGLTAACDITIAIDSAALSFSEVRIGVIPAMISVVVLPKIGIHNAMRLFLTGERFSAEQAMDYGLIHRVCPVETLDSVVDEVVSAICLGGPNAIKEAKQLVRTVPHLSMDEGFRYTAERIGRLFASDEAREGMEAFLQKRRPKWVPGGE
jgi:methylglutaconyl-CoA hydratase